MIVYLVGDSKLKPDFERITKQLMVSRNDMVVLHPEFYPSYSIVDEAILKMHGLRVQAIEHKKIDISDAILVVTPLRKDKALNNRPASLDIEAIELIRYASSNKKPICTRVEELW